MFANGNNGFISYAASTDYLTLPLFATATNTNAQSRSKSVSFVAPWNLRLAGSSIGDTALACLPLSLVRTDIDNQLRDPFNPYMGCDESVANPLPVILMHFEALAQGVDVNVTWKTAQEVNNNGFYLERSFDGVRFEPIAFYKGAINSQRPTIYNHVDKEILRDQDKVYYKLVQEDLNGSQSVLGLRLVQTNDLNNDGLVVFPNPANATVWIKPTVAGTLFKIVLFSLEGKLLREWEQLGSAQTIAGATALDIIGLNQGIYLLNIQVGNTTYVIRMMIE